MHAFGPVRPTREVVAIGMMGGTMRHAVPSATNQHLDEAEAE
jgi:hypothetical protein